jgi:hypothetical protein
VYYSGTGKEEFPSPRNFDEIIARAPHLDLDVSVPGVLPDRRLHITRLTIIDAFNVVRLEYEIIPLNEPPSPESAEVSRAYCPWGWMVGGRDDRGTVYDDRGGAYGVPPNGLVADGERDLFPFDRYRCSTYQTILMVDPMSRARLRHIFTQSAEEPLSSERVHLARHRAWSVWADGRG